MENEKMNLTAFKTNNAHLVFNTPNEICVWRVKTLLSKEPETIRWLLSLNENDILWDIGGNIGLYSIYAASLKKCQVYSFEPESQNYALLNRNIKLNKLEKFIKSYCIGVSDKSGLNSLKVSSFNVGSSGHNLDDIEINFQGCVTYSIDNLVDLGLPCPTHLKIDVDGLDHIIVYGAKKVLSNIKSILIELDTSNEEQMKVIEFLENYDFYYDPKQVENTARPKGDKFEHLREFIFIKY